MVENKCNKCGRQQEYTVTIVTDRKENYGTFDNNSIEKWCFDCLRAKILWPKPDTASTKHVDFGLGIKPGVTVQPAVDPPNTNRPKSSDFGDGKGRFSYPWPSPREALDEMKKRNEEKRDKVLHSGWDS